MCQWCLAYIPESPCLYPSHIILSHQHLFFLSPSVFPIILLKATDHSHLTLQFVCMYSRVFLRMHICVRMSNKSGRRSQWCHLHLHWNLARQYESNDISFPLTCVIMPDDAALLKAVGVFVHLKGSRWTLVPGLCNCCWSISKHSSPRPWSSRHPWNLGPLHPSCPPAHPKAPLHLLLISRSDTLN